MTTGLGFGEIVLVLAALVMFFGSKELPRFIREIASLMAKARKYSDKIRREMDELSRPVQEVAGPELANPYIRKRDLRKSVRDKLTAMTPDERREKSRTITDHVKMLNEYKNAPSIMCYASDESEVDTRALIHDALGQGKRVALPFCRPGTNELGIGEITDYEKDLKAGPFGILEPVEEKKDNFFKSDLRLVLCPGVAFDREGGRLGRGKGYYDSFLSELKGKAPIIGLAFGAQILDDPVPFDYHDMPMDQVITENGPVITDREPEGVNVPVDDAHSDPETTRKTNPGHSTWRRP